MNPSNSYNELCTATLSMQSKRHLCLSYRQCDQMIKEDGRNQSATEDIILFCNQYSQVLDMGFLYGKEQSIDVFSGVGRSYNKGLRKQAQRTTKHIQD